jgi:large subunit ribosomal protein L21
MYAIVRIAGKQYVAEPGKALVTERLSNKVGDKIEIGDVLLIGDGDNTMIGQPFVDGGLVRAEVVEQFKAKKVVVFKYKRKERYRRKSGHRHQYTRLMINSIVSPSAKKSRSKKSEPAEETEA